MAALINGHVDVLDQRRGAGALLYSIQLPANRFVGRGKEQIIGAAKCGNSEICW